MLWHREELFHQCQKGGPKHCNTIVPAHVPQALHLVSGLVHLTHVDFSSLLPRGEQFKIPHHCGPDDVVHEVELGIIFNGLGNEHHWMDRIGAYVLLLDMTDRNHLG